MFCLAWPDHRRTVDSTAPRPTVWIRRSVAVLSLIEIISLAASRTVTVLLSGRSARPPWPVLLHSGLIVSLVFQLSPPSRTFLATAPIT